MIGIVGLSHKTAAVGVRERITLTAESVPSFLGILRNTYDIAEAVVLSTCNRTEITFHSSSDCLARHAEAIIEALRTFRDVTVDLTPYMYSFGHQDAVRHLLSVAAGLDSMVIGENQILMQVRKAYQTSVKAGHTAAVLNRLFHKALEVGKRVRSETAINRGAATIGAAAVELAAKVFDDLESRPILIVGAGETGEQVLKAFSERGCRSLFMANRTDSRARDVAEKYNARAVEYREWKQLLGTCDILVTSVAVTVPFVTPAAFGEVFRSRRGMPFLLIDLSVPRAVDEEIGKIENVLLHTIDDLQEVVASTFQHRAEEIRKAEAIISPAVNEYFSWLDSLRLLPTIESLKSKFESISDAELRKLKNRLPENEYEKVQEYARFINGKYLGLLIKNLKLLSSDGRRLDCVEILRELFELGRGEKK